MALEDPQPLTDKMVEACLTWAGMPSDSRDMISGSPLWSSDHEKAALMDAYRQGWDDALESVRVRRIQQSIEQPGSVRDGP